MTNLTNTRNYLSDLIRKAGEIIKHYFYSGNYASKSKGGVDFLTEADTEVDKFLLENLKRKYPDANFLTEETAPKDYSDLKKLDNLWVIDPLDGTINFSRVNPHFAISVGLVNRGVSELGVVYLPISGELYFAQQDLEEAFLNNKPIQVSNTSDLKEVVLACDWGWDVEKRLEVVRWLEKISTKVRQVKSMGSAVADFATLAAGKIDVYIHSNLKPWDTAASSLIIRKAGGKITNTKGGKWDIFTQDMLASNGILHERILNLINK